MPTHAGISHGFFKRAAGHQMAPPQPGDTISTTAEIVMEARLAQMLPPPQSHATHAPDDVARQRTKAIQHFRELGIADPKMYVQILPYFAKAQTVAEVGHLKQLLTAEIARRKAVESMAAPPLHLKQRRAAEVAALQDPAKLTTILHLHLQVAADPPMYLRLLDIIVQAKSPTEVSQLYDAGKTINTLLPLRAVDRHGYEQLCNLVFAAHSHAHIAALSHAFTELAPLQKADAYAHVVLQSRLLAAASTEEIAELAHRVRGVSLIAPTAKTVPTGYRKLRDYVLAAPDPRDVEHILQSEHYATLRAIADLMTP